MGYLGLDPNIPSCLQRAKSNSISGKLTVNLLKSHLIIGFLFGIQIVSMGAMEMSGPFWPIHLQHNSSGWLLSFL